MDINKILIEQNQNRDKKLHGIFANLFIIQNRLQTAFDSLDSTISIKQFMLLIIIKLSKPNETYTNYGNLLGCSRQNIKKLITSLEKNNFIEIEIDKSDKRKKYIVLTEIAEEYFSKYSDLHTQKLNLLFDDYSDEEIDRFYTLTSQLYSGIERIESNNEK